MLRSEKWRKGEVLAYVGLCQNLKDLKDLAGSQQDDVLHHTGRCGLLCCLPNTRAITLDYLHPDILELFSYSTCCSLLLAFFLNILRVANQWALPAHHHLCCATLSFSQRSPCRATASGHAGCAPLISFSCQSTRLNFRVQD